MKLVINRCFGGFGLSEDAVNKIALLKGDTIYPGDHYGTTYFFRDKELTDIYDCNGIERNDPILVQVVEMLGEAADGEYAELSIVEIPDDVDWQICEYDGNEWVAEAHRTWS